MKDDLMASGTTAQDGSFSIDWTAKHMAGGTTQTKSTRYSKEKMTLNQPAAKNQL